MDGLLNIHKTAGVTSHDVVDEVRRVFAQKRVGHAGTLDPMATGVLIVCLGRATRIVEYVSNAEKEYRGVLALGVTTDTLDSTGAIVGESDASGVTLEALKRAAGTFVGEIEQVPPMVSAVKYQGERLYKLAREGRTVDRAARKVNVYSIDVGGFRPGARAGADMAVSCSSGTYIRTLCADIGQALGCGGMMSGLERTRVGRFALDQAVTIDELRQARGEGCLAGFVISMADALADMPAVALDADARDRVLHGLSVAASERLEPGSTVRMMSAEGELTAIGVVVEEDGSVIVKPRKVLGG